MESIVIPGGSEIHLGPGVIESGQLLPERAERRRAAVVTQPGAASIGRRVGRMLRDSGLAVEVRVLPDGEAAKTLDVVADVYAWLAELGIERSDSVVAVGGGTVTDTAGFAAATYMRGVEWAAVPTTLLAAVDAAIGGKTGVNLGGKNLIGAFWHPVRVVIDTELLTSLPPELAADGLAEAAKAAMVGDVGLMQLMETAGPAVPLETVVARAVEVKAAIVTADFREGGRRAHLNYGHTIGHALEVVAALRHGPAVALGMVAAGAVAARSLGFAGQDRQRRLLERLGLPVSIDGVDPDEVRALLAHDKKRVAGRLRMVLLHDFGQPTVVEVEEDHVVAGLAAVGAG